ncbi:hypothetical protein ACFX2I_011105 [Malus domestica]
MDVRAVERVAKRKAVETGDSSQAAGVAVFLGASRSTKALLWTVLPQPTKVYPLPQEYKAMQEAGSYNL